MTLGYIEEGLYDAHSDGLATRFRAAGGDTQRRPTHQSFAQSRQLLRAWRPGAREDPHGRRRQGAGAARHRAAHDARRPLRLRRGTVHRRERGVVLLGLQSLLLAVRHWGGLRLRLALLRLRRLQLVLRSVLLRPVVLLEL